MALKRSRVRVPLGPSYADTPSPLLMLSTGDFYFPPTVMRSLSREGIVVAKQKNSPLDNLGSRVRELLEDLERLLNPPQPKRERALVPIPIRNPRPTDRRYR